MVLAATAGIAAGLLHVLTGPDHLAAVAPLAVDAGHDAHREQPRQTWRAGFQWGLGHSAGVVLIGLLLLLLRERLPLDLVSGYSERMVGVAMLCLGGWGAWRAMGMGRRPHVHPPAGASFAMGVLHGLAGSAHLFGILPALAFATRADALSYLAGFGAGAVGGMTVFAAAVGVVASRFERRGRAASQRLLYACAAAAFLVGGVWLVG